MIGEQKACFDRKDKTKQVCIAAVNDDDDDT
jgi:hypothetical protein